MSVGQRPDQSRSESKRQVKKVEVEVEIDGERVEREEGIEWIGFAVV